MTIDHISPLWLLVLLGLMGALAGLAALLRDPAREVNGRSICSAIFNSGFICIITGALLFEWYGTDRRYLVIGISLLAGLGGNATIEHATSVLQGYIRAVGQKNANDRDSEEED